MKAYEKAHAWRELFTMAKEQQLDEGAIAAMVERVTGELTACYLEPCTDDADHLSSRGKNLDAAQVFMDYAKDVDSAVQVLSKGLEFAEAQRLVCPILLTISTCLTYRPLYMIDRISSNRRFTPDSRMRMRN
jgi:elongator complex protein 1